MIFNLMANEPVEMLVQSCSGCAQPTISDHIASDGISDCDISLNPEQLFARFDCFIVKYIRVASVRAAWRELVKLFRKPKSKFYWYDFTVRGYRYRGSTQETKSVRALHMASLKLASVMENTDPLPGKPPVLDEFAERFLDWVDRSRLEEKTRKFYRNGWRLLKATSVAAL